MPDLISSDHPLTEPERSKLSALLDTLLPASEKLEMPSAAEVEFETYLITQKEDLLPLLQQVLEHFESGFAELGLDQRVELVKVFSEQQPELFMTLLPSVYDCYYQNDQVRQKIGVVTGAVFPQGNELISGDLTLLDPVIENSDRHRYRDE